MEDAWCQAVPIDTHFMHMAVWVHMLTLYLPSHATCCTLKGGANEHDAPASAPAAV